MILVSACLAGFNCRFDGSSKPNDKIIQLIKDGKAIPVCPEQLAGLATPRKATEQRSDGRILSEDSEDFTAEFQKGAEEVLAICKQFGCTKAILKSKSPSCGSGQVFDGSFTSTLTDGYGVTAKLLKENGIEVISESDLLI
ncbi:DUF523 domain-containing protein [Candidatus Saccharibacteria bacterium]|nr:DUF523 domain-containing protein [Candidatus Saccharibacteria bacterium]